MDKLFITIPAYNEAANIEQVINDWYPIIEKYDNGGTSKLVIVDDGSSDDTYDKICKCAATRPLLVPLTKKNSGHGATVLWAYRYALAHNADFIFQTDSDGQTLPSEFAQFWEVRNQYDLVIGWRNKRQDGISRIIVTKILKAVIRLCFHVTVTDANTPFRLMKASSLKKYIHLIPEEHNLSNVLLTVIYTKKNRAIKYIPITFRPRQGGVNSINLSKIFKLGLKALKDFKYLNKKI